MFWYWLGEKSNVRLMVFPHWGYTEKPKQTLQNNYICLLEDRKTFGLLTGGL